jgi:hypothetical protein
MIIANKIWVNERFDGVKRDYIRVEFEFQEFPDTENKIIDKHIRAIGSTKGNIEFFRRTESEKPKNTKDGLFFCVDGEISINKAEKSAFAYYHCLVGNDDWNVFRTHVTNNQSKILHIKFSTLYGKIESEDEDCCVLKVQFGFDRLAWCYDFSKGS